jgi:hypothetical protein
VTVAIRVAAVGVKPDVPERCTRYRVTATLSLDALQLSVAWPTVPAVIRPSTTDGGAVSGSGKMLRIAASDGTPSASSRKT